METDRISETLKRAQAAAKMAVQCVLEVGNAQTNIPETKYMRLARHPELASADGEAFLEVLVNELLRLLVEKPREVHKICAALPWMGEYELSALADNIREHGITQECT